MRRTVTGRRTSRALDVFWTVFAGAVVVAFVLGVASSAREYSGPSDLVGIALFTLVSYWLGAGAWLRTSWGQRRLERAGSGDPAGE